MKSNATATGRAAELRTIRILLIDDDPQARALMEMALVDAHFESTIDIAGTASEGLVWIRADQHDVYLVDYFLPDGTGLELIHQAKAEGATKPFILMTGNGSGELDDAALAEGAADYVEKHLVSSQLERSIRYALRDWHSQRALLDREEQLRQAQKMEAIGRLAGGVAHDFNNLLTAIIGYADMAVERLDPADTTARDVREIRRAADRAASLTRQLLAFSRKQFLNPTILDLNETVADLLQMLPRVIGEHIHTTTRLWPNVSRVRADASQMEQVLMNLVLNARDAIPHGGEVTIETAEVDLTEDRIAAEALSLAPGDYVMLAVSDTGSGMDENVRAHAFEPFFTTKAKGKGTGLGLATVYGIVEQSGGGISLDTAPGRGTTVRIYLPVTSAAGDTPRPEPVSAFTEGTETLLLVEDNDAVRDLAARALRRRGYVVHEARTAEEALASAARLPAKPRLVITDVVMPGLSGPNLAARLLQENPELKVLYMSGYSDEAASGQGLSGSGVPLLQKPFTPNQLAERVRAALDTPSPSP